MIQIKTIEAGLIKKIGTLVSIFLIILTPSITYANFIGYAGAETAPNIAEIEVTGDKLQIRFEISAEDAEKFWPEILPTESIYELAIAVKKHKKFAVKIFTEKREIKPTNSEIRIAERKPRNSPFAGKLDPRTGLRAPKLPDDEIILLANIEYPIKGVSHLDIQPPLGNDGEATVTIGFTSQHGKTPVSNFQYLSRTESLNIDWKDPWNTKFSNHSLNRQNRYPLQSFLYVEPRQIRHEILLRPKDLLRWTDQNFNAWQPLTTKKRELLRRTTLKYLRGKNPTTIDREISEPISTEIIFLKANEAGYTKITEDESIEIGSLLIGYRERFKIKELPQSVSIDWTIFTDAINSVPTLIQDPAGPFPTHVAPDFPDIQWRNYLYDYRAPNSGPVLIENPSAVIPMAVLFGFCIFIFFILTLRTRRVEAKNKHPILFYSIVLICAGAIYYTLPGELRIPLPGTVNKKELEQMVETLLKRLAAAYEEPQTEALNTRLSNLISDENFKNTTTNLSHIFQPVTSSGNSGSLRSINNLEVEYAKHIVINGNKAFRITSKWQATAEGYNWGQIEKKTREIRANIEIIQSDKHWKVFAFTSLSIR
ncbi:hypothetical protein ACJJIG_15360 [Microbulbifer sp. SSSA007]|uniref:hypothetical protein n=1 Tax=Microbulbifer sp. SSSA007 TaxID=3243379 RepID=UPI0040394DA6